MPVVPHTYRLNDSPNFSFYTQQDSEGIQRIKEIKFAGTELCSNYNVGEAYDVLEILPKAVPVGFEYSYSIEKHAFVSLNLVMNACPYH